MSLSLAKHVQKCRESGRKVFLPFLTAGYPSADLFAELLRRCRVADIIEVGLPFSDPVADGPTICHSSDVALAQGMHTEKMFDILSSEHELPPIVLMTYVNPVLAFGAKEFFRRAAASGVRGVILTDIPPEDATELFGLAEAEGIASVLLVSPTTPDERMRKIAEKATGFLYCVSVTGTTGARSQMSSQARDTLERLRRITTLPVVVGFGLSTEEQVRTTCTYADGAVVGSALVDFIRQRKDDPRLPEAFETRIGALAHAAHSVVPG